MTDDETRGWLRRLGRHLPTFEAPGFRFGSWMPAQERDDEVIVMGWYEPGPEANAFLADARVAITPLAADGPRPRRTLRGRDARGRLRVGDADRHPARRHPRHVTCGEPCDVQRR